MSDEKKVLLRISNLKQYFPIGKKKVGKPQAYVKANDGISLNIYEGETFGLVGESGCGKSTFGRTLLQLYHQTGGRTVYYGRTVEDFDLKYVEEIFKNLPEKKKKCEELLAKVEKLQAEYDKMPDGTPQEEIAKKAAGQHLAEADSDAKNHLLDITALIGGLYTLKDAELAEAGKHYTAEYLAMKEIRKLNEEADNAEKVGKSDKAAECRRKIPDLEKKVEEELAEIQKIRDNCPKDAKFEEYEQQKDNGINLANLTDAEMRYLRRDLQLIFQDPYSSLNPRMTVGDIIGEGIDIHKLYTGKERQEKIYELLELVGLNREHALRFPHEFSGGQRQRIGIARALAIEPEFIVCDEPISALDVSIQAQVVNLLIELQQKKNLTYLFIAHDLSMVKHISDRVGVMYLGNMVEFAESDELYQNPLHPYTKALMAAIPIPDPDTEEQKKRIRLEGEIPSPVNPKPGCRFVTRCRYATEKCHQETPQLEELKPEHFVACHRAKELMEDHPQE